VKTRIVRIGNSQGVRIPRPLIEQAGLVGDVEMTVQNGTLIIRSIAKPREGWAMAFQKMARMGDDALILEDSPALTSWDEDEWEW